MTDARRKAIEEALAELGVHVEKEEAIDPYSYVMGLDPGGTTGVALLRYTATTKPELIYLHQIEGGANGFLEWFQGSELASNLDVASEVWVERNIKGADRTPLLVQGVMLALWGEPENLHWQEPKMKHLIGDDYLHEQNLWTPGKRHQMDALIHALVFLRNNDHEPTQKSVAGENSPEDTIAQEGEAESKQLEDAVRDMADASAKAGAAMEELVSSIQAFADSVSEQNFGNDNSEPSGHKHTDEFTGKGARRERNGAFAGYAPEDGGNVKELYSD